VCRVKCEGAGFRFSCLGFVVMFRGFAPGKILALRVSPGFPRTPCSSALLPRDKAVRARAPGKDIVHVSVCLSERESKHMRARESAREAK
jgi:hypothetical protein